MQLLRLTSIIGMAAIAASCRTATTENSVELKADYRDVSVGDYGDRTVHISECGDKTFLGFMKEHIYPAIVEQSRAEQRSKLAGVIAGDGVEVRLRPDVTTYHVAFPTSRQGGRSFGAVGTGRTMEYVADASYSFYFDSLEKVYWHDPAQLQGFFEVVFSILLKCDASGFDNLNKYVKRVAVDFVAVYIAEQYRNLVKYNGRRLSTHDWDNAHLQTTMLAAFHAGQTRDEKGMFFEGRFRKQTYDTWDCVYKKRDRGGKLPRDMRLRDYTQANAECKRSGVGQTRRDWQKLTRAIGDHLANSRELEAVQRAFRSRSNNAIETAANFITTFDNEGPYRNADEMVKSIVNYLMLVQKEALNLTRKLSGTEQPEDDAEFDSGNTFDVSEEVEAPVDFGRLEPDFGPNMNPSLSQ